MTDNIVKVFKHRNQDEKWTYDCIECKIGGDYAPDVDNAFYEAEQHLIECHTDLQPWEVLAA